MAVVTESFLPTVNGVTNSVLRVLEHLHATGHDALVVCPDSGSDPRSYAGAPVVRVPTVTPPALGGFHVGLPSRRLLRTIRDFDPDVVHLASPFILGAHGAHVARRLGVPFVAVYQTDVAGFARSYGLPTAATTLAWRWLRHVHQHADRTLAPSRAAAAELRAHGVERVALWPRGVDAGAFAPRHRSDAWRRALGIADGDAVVGYVGRLAPEKRVDHLRALRDVPGTRLLVVGDGPSRAALERSLPEAVFTGFLTGPELSVAHASIDIFVQPSVGETFCQAAQEALASGVPVVAAACGGLLDLVDDGRNGRLVAPDDARDLRDAVAAYVRDPAARRAAGAQARRSVLARTWGAVCTDLVAHYEDVAGVQRHPSQPRIAA